MDPLTPIFCGLGIAAVLVGGFLLALMAFCSWWHKWH